jgi:uncharacterized membrane protein
MFTGQLSQAELDALMMLIRNLPKIAHELERIAEASERIAEALEDEDESFEEDISEEGE